MSDIQTSTSSESGFVSTSQVGDFELTIDATGEAGPTPNAVLVSDYAACFLPAFRVGGRQRGHDDLGRIQIDADADVGDDDDLQAIRFDIYVEADLDDETLGEILDRAENICHVHSALREELQAEVRLHGNAF